MPQSMRRLGLLSSRNPARLADSSPGAFTVDSGGSNSHRAPYAITPMNWKVAKATNAILTTINGQPRCRASPVQTPPSHAPSATLVARGLSSESAAPESERSSSTIGGAAAAALSPCWRRAIRSRHEAGPRAVWAQARGGEGQARDGSSPWRS